MSAIEKNISQFIKSQFPAVYREEGEIFVEFVTKYYEWMEESNNVIYHARRLSEYKDIDLTVDDYVLNFKKKYLDGIQFDTAAKTRNLVKHSLDLYRAKGTERSVDLFFRAVYGAPVEVYYPGEDVFRLSDGTWVRPQYLEITNNDFNAQFVGKIVQGINSKATAFVERYIKRKIKSKFIHLFYISAITGEFETGELLSLVGSTSKDTPTVIGSMSGLQVITGGFDFEVGDIVNLTSNTGTQGKARVVTVSNLTGSVTYELLDSGWGYTSEANVIISEKVLFLSNVVANSEMETFAFETFETLKQPLANISIINANSALSLVNNSLLFTYYSNGSVAGQGIVLGYTANGSTNGEVYVAEIRNTLGPVVEPAANLSGTVSLSLLDSPITGVSSVTSGSANVTGNNTFYVSDLKVGQIIKLYAYNANNLLITSQENKVQSIANNTHFTLLTNSSVTSTNVVAIHVLGARQVIGTGTAFNSDFVYGDSVAFYSNTSNYIIKTVNAVVNATYMTVQEPVTFSNTSVNYADVSSNNRIYTASNTISANISTRQDKSATANIMGVSTKNTLKIVNSSATFSNTEFIYQLNSDGDEVAIAKITSVVATGSNATIVTSNTVGVFFVNTAQPVRTRFANGLVTGKTANLTQLDFEVGVISVTNTFITNENNFVYGLNSFSNATVSRVSTGTLANVSVSNTRTFSETVTFTSDPIEFYENVPLNALAYGFPANPTANVSTHTMDDIFTTRTVTMGGIASLTGQNPGKNYDYAPFVVVYDKNTLVYNRQDFEIELSNLSGGFFSVGEIITQVAGGTGIVKSSNASHISVKRITFENSFDLATEIVGTSTGVTANIFSISEKDNTLQIGLNAIVQTNVQTSNGSVNTLEIIDSGFGYIQDETATFTSNDGTRAGTTKINLGKSGISEGFYRNRNGQVSADKKIFDGEYYQDFSYEVRTPIHVDKYSEMLKNILHVAGTKLFSATVLSEVANSSINIKSDISTE